MLPRFVISSSRIDGELSRLLKFWSLNVLHFEALVNISFPLAYHSHASCFVYLENSFFSLFFEEIYVEIYFEFLCLTGCWKSRFHWINNSPFALFKHHEKEKREEIFA